MSASTWSLHDSIAYECAHEALNEVLAIRMGEIYTEEGRAHPDARRLAQLRVQVDELAQRRRTLMPEDRDTIEQIRRECGAIARSHRAQASPAS